MSCFPPVVQCLLVLLLQCAGAVSNGNLHLVNITASVFGVKPWDLLPVAFGDFNSDKLTDIFVLDSSRSKVSILLATKQTLMLHSDTIFDMDAKANKVECAINGATIEAVMPGDFDGDGGMDVAVVASSDDGQFAFVLWGQHDQVQNEHRLMCHDQMPDWHHRIPMASQPLLLDVNGDYIADLFGALNDSSNRGFWIFSPRRHEAPNFVQVHTTQHHTGPFSSPHSNAFVDLNGDGNADIIATTGAKEFEVWENMGGRTKKSSPSDQLDMSFAYVKNVAIPGCDDCVLGQAAFADFNLDGSIDMIVPVCYDDQCHNSTLYFAHTQNLIGTHGSGEDAIFFALPVDFSGDWRFHVEPTGADPYSGVLTPRIGDINLDGYPDILMRMSGHDGAVTTTQLLLNVASDSGIGRGFQVQPEVTQDLGNLIMATFYDIHEDGLLDILAVDKDPATGSYYLKAFSTRTQDSDAYFLKVIVLSGVCYHSCTNNHMQVPYGTNSPGQTICYRTQRAGLEVDTAETTSCAAQLVQTAHTPLQLPYTIFGLGQVPSFVDYMSVNVTNSSDASHGRVWSQIIPNSQMYIIPFPTLYPASWQVKLFITPSRSIFLTAISLIGTCLLASIIIGFLHWRERRIDHKEKMQDAHLFHFDAM